MSNSGQESQSSAQPALSNYQSDPSPFAATNQPPNSTGLPSEAIDLATKLFNAARSGDSQLLVQYITAGIPANLTNHDGATLLMLAAYHGHAATVRMLLSHGADANALNERGQSPLAGAVFKGYGEVVKVLVMEGLADAYAGQPNAVDTARMFKRVDMLAMMGVVNGQESQQQQSQVQAPPPQSQSPES